jgi:hypothetical protein
MLFDLRSRGRRRTVQGVYLGLALLMGGGLVLFGVGAGNGFGGILNAFNGSGNGSAQKQAVSQQEKQALAQTKADPKNPAGWFALVQARYASAGQGNDFNTATSTYTAAGHAELTAATVAWQSYLQVTKHPDPQLAVLAARAYDILGQYKSETSAWQIVTAANPKVPTYYEDLAVAAYQGKQVSLGDLAAAKAVSLAPKTTRSELQQQLKQLRTQALGASAAKTAPVIPSTSAATTSTPAGSASTPSSSTATGKKKKK